MFIKPKIFTNLHIIMYILILDFQLVVGGGEMFTYYWTNHARLSQSVESRSLSHLKKTLEVHGLLSRPRT